MKLSDNLLRGLVLFLLPACANSFSPLSSSTWTSVSTNLAMSSFESNNGNMHSFCSLPGDPSLILTTNIDLGSNKNDIMKACSRAIAKHPGKPESCIGVSITDNASAIFAGPDAPTALGCVYSIGAIGQESNGAITAAVTDFLEPFGLEENRIYINVFDMPRANVGWSRRTFAGLDLDCCSAAFV